MLFNHSSTRAANKARKLIQKQTETISEGEAAAIAAWYSFINDHAMCEGVDPKSLAREQFEAFINDMAIEVVREH